MVRLKETLRVLQSPGRRSVLFSLRDKDVAGDGLAVPGDIVHGPVSEQREIRLYHTALPRLEECGFIRWDHTEDRVYRGPEFGSLEPFLEAIDKHDGREPITIQ
jgi:hypothetical protein